MCTLIEKQFKNNFTDTILFYVFTAIVKKIVEPGGKSSVKLSGSAKPLPSAETVTRWGRSKELEARSVGFLRRGSSAENVNKPPSPLPQLFADKLLAPNGNLKRLKTGKEQVAAETSVHLNLKLVVWNKQISNLIKLNRSLIQIFHIRKLFLVKF